MDLNIIYHKYYMCAADDGKWDGDNQADTRDPTPTTRVLSRGSERGRLRVHGEAATDQNNDNIYRELRCGKNDAERKTALWNLTAGMEKAASFYIKKIVIFLYFYFYLFRF